MADKHILKVNNLKKHYPVKGGIFQTTKGYVYAVDDVSFNLKVGETLGIVGESGCGKSTLARQILRLETPTAGEIVFEGTDISKMPQGKLRPLRRDMQVVFQDPFASLNPRMTVGQILMEPLEVHKIGTAKERDERVDYLLEKVGLRSSYRQRYPHEFSGGQRQRISIARALALEPKLIILDEPVSALDVSIQAQILNLMMDLQEEMGLTYLFIAHDLAVVEHMSDRVLVLYLGKVVESASSYDLFSKPRHPYTKALFDSIPKPVPKLRGGAPVLEGDVPSPMNPPKGCPFHPRCRFAQDICRKEVPKIEPVKGMSGDEHVSACHFNDKIDFNLQ